MIKKTQDNGMVRPEDLKPPVASEDERTWPFWVGCLPSSPTSLGILAGNIWHPKVVEKVIPGSGTLRRTERVPMLGAIRELSLAQLARYRDRLPRSILRRVGGIPVDPLPGEKPGDVPRRRSPRDVFQRILLLNDVERAELQELGRAHIINQRSPRPGDLPCAQYVYLLPAPGGMRPGDTVPAPVSAIGFCVRPDLHPELFEPSPGVIEGPPKAQEIAASILAGERPSTDTATRLATQSRELLDE